MNFAERVGALASRIDREDRYRREPDMGRVVIASHSQDEIKTAALPLCHDRGPEPSPRCQLRSAAQPGGLEQGLDVERGDEVLVVE